MTTRGKAALMVAGLAVAAGIAAPAAIARPTCQQTDFKSICATNGSVSIKARPGTVALRATCRTCRGSAALDGVSRPAGLPPGTRDRLNSLSRKGIRRYAWNMLVQI